MKAFTAKHLFWTTRSSVSVLEAYFKKKKNISPLPDLLKKSVTENSQNFAACFKSSVTLKCHRDNHAILWVGLRSISLSQFEYESQLGSVVLNIITY